LCGGIIELVEPYIVSIVQIIEDVIGSREDMKPILKRYTELIDSAAATASGGARARGVPTKLIAFPEFFIHGGTVYLPHEDQLKLALPIPGPETDVLAEKAVEHDTYIVGQANEVDPEWPDRFFNCSFILDPNGKVILKYRKVNPASPEGIELATSPHDMWDEYAKKYGTDPKTLFPVADTPIGRLGCFPCFEGEFPEVARALALNGAEILIRPTVYPTGAQTEPTDLWTLFNRARAVENTVYLLAPNSASRHRTAFGYQSMGRSQIIDYKGRILVEAGCEGEAIVSTEIDIELLRTMRQIGGGINYLPMLRTELYAEVYKKTCFPPNQRIMTQQEGPKISERVVEEFYRKNIFVKPTSRLKNE
jgi:predicted amidohydrolase